MWNRALASHVQPAVALDQAVETNFVHFVGNSFVSPELEREVAGVGTSEATGRSVDPAPGNPDGNL